MFGNISKFLKTRYCASSHEMQYENACRFSTKSAQNRTYCSLFLFNFQSKKAYRRATFRSLGVGLDLFRKRTGSTGETNSCMLCVWSWVNSIGKCAENEAINENVEEQNYGKSIIEQRISIWRNGEVKLMFDCEKSMQKQCIKTKTTDNWPITRWNLVDDEYRKLSFWCK